MRPMLFAVVLMIVLAPIGALAEPSTQPAMAPATQPTTTAVKAFSTPAELVEQMKQLRAKKEARPKVAYIDLSRPIQEAPAGMGIFGPATSNTLRTVLERIERAKDDDDVKAVLITIGGDASLGLAQAQEIRDALEDVGELGKPVYVYADSYSTVTYTLASGATDVCMMDAGEVLLPGLSSTAMFAKGLLDKVGVQADYVQIGEYKGASEPYTRTDFSVEMRGETNKLLDALYDEIVSGIARRRNLGPDAVKAMIDEAFVAGAAARDRGLVDHLVDQDGLRELLNEKLGHEVEIVHNYGQPKRPDVDLSNPLMLLAAISKRPEPTDKPVIALVYVDGMIVDGRGGESLLGDSGVGADDVRKAMRMALRDDQVEAVVVRIDSPGGSALASEVMWQAVRRVAKEKPVIISVGDMAASGGYYVASAGDYIFADSAGVVGSIGVVGGKFVAKELFQKLGLTTENLSRGQNAGLFSMDQPFSEQQREIVTRRMKQVYETFTQRVMATREGKIADIDLVARGRVFGGKQAKDLGMVDEIGGLNDAIAHAARQAELGPDVYEVKVLPPPATLADVLLGTAGETITPIRPGTVMGSTSGLQLLPTSVRDLLLQQAQVIRLLDRSPVLLVTPYVVTVE